MKQLLAEADKERKTRRQQLDRENEVIKSMLDAVDDSDEDEKEEKEKLVLPDHQGEKWDAESILSTYSTLYNHPKIISERKKVAPIVLSSKSGVPKDVLGRGLTAAALKQLDLENDQGCEDDLQSVRSRMSTVSIRPKHETVEEKRARKSELKNLRKERREEKKANTQAFKSEKIRQEKVNLNLKNNLQGIKIC